MAAAQNKLHHPADRLLDAIAQKGSPVCVGLDPVVEKLPHSILAEISGLGSAIADSQAIGAIEQFCSRVMQAVADHVPCVKLQSACFERFGSAGVAALESAIEQARALGLQVILDAKRGDIGLTAEHYACAAFKQTASTTAGADWITINSYLGEDGITPFLKRAVHGAFALVRTSNPGGDAVQAMNLHDGRTVAEAVAGLIASIGNAHLGQSGYSSLGAVVGATKASEAKSLRRIMPRQIFLVPGYGAQGGAVDDALACFNTDGRGAIISASRSVIYAFEPNDAEWPRSVKSAAANFANEIAKALNS